LQIRVLVFSKVSSSIKSGIFSSGYFPSFGFLKISLWLWLKKFRVRLTQVFKIGFKVFRQSFGKQVVSFSKVLFHGLRFVWSSQVSKIGYTFSAKVLVSLVRTFSPGSLFLAK
jgi:hypothetical protein